MPHKFNAGRRDKIPKQKHRMTNWAEYNEGLRRRYSGLAIEMCLTLGLAFEQPLRQTQGFKRSIAKLLGVEIAVPDFSTLSRRGSGLTLRPKPNSKSAKQSPSILTWSRE